MWCGKKRIDSRLPHPANGHQNEDLFKCNSVNHVVALKWLGNAAWSGFRPRSGQRRGRGERIGGSLLLLLMVNAARLSRFGGVANRPGALLCGCGRAAEMSLRAAK